MLTHTFCHCRGLGRGAERKLWTRGVLTWDAFLRSRGAGALSDAKTQRVAEQLQESQQALAAGDADYFIQRLPPLDRPRLFAHFRPRCLYLDIETTGLSPNADITTAALYDGRRVQTFVAGRDLDQLPRALRPDGLLVTYNGARFDLPRLRRRLGIRLAQPHLDLCPVLKAFGYRGGLKAAERQLRIPRQTPSDLDGEDAPRLWRRFQHGDSAALRLLLAYNAQDTLSLELILVKLYNHLIREFPIKLKPIPPPIQPLIWPAPAAT